MEDYIAEYMERYLPRKEIIHRLPLTLPISRLWPALQKARREKSQDLPLHDASGKLYWWVLTDSITQQADEIISLARRDIIFSSPEFEAMFREAVIDEAVYSSIIEGAFTTKQEAREFIDNHREPKNKSEQMVKNNYDALTYVLEHIDASITAQTIFDIYEIVTKNTLDEDVPKNAYRNVGVVVQTGHGEIVHKAPDYAAVPALMADLVSFIGESELPPIIKACVAHFYFVYVHPFVDGNGRTARALSYMMLLQAGYDFFRYFSISSVIAEERGKYYRAIKSVEEDDNDMTYFIDYYSAMLARAIHAMDGQLIDRASLEKRMHDNDVLLTGNDRLRTGLEWIMGSDKLSITIEEWRKKFGVVNETARQDLFKLEKAGFVERKGNSRKYIFVILR